MDTVAQAPGSSPPQSPRQRLVRGSSVYALSSLGLRALGFALLAVYSRYFSPRDYGVVSLAEIVGVIVGIVASLGLENGSRRMYFQFAGDAERLRRYLGAVLRLAIGASTAALAVAYLAGPWLAARIAIQGNVTFFPYLALPIFTGVTMQLLQCRLAVYQCQERLAAYTGFIVLQSLSTTIFTFGLVVWTRHGAVGLLAARALGAGLSLLVALLLSGSYLRARPDWAAIRETLHISLPLVPHGLLAVGLVSIDRFILQHYRPLSEVGLYTLAYNVGLIMTLVAGSLSRAWTPLFFSLLLQGEAGRRSAGAIFDELAVLLTLIAGAGVLLSPLALRGLFDPHYWPAARVAPVVLAAYLCHSLFVLFQIAVIQSRRTALVGVVSGAALLSNVVLNFAWVPRHGMAGAAYATLAAYALELVLIALLAHRLLPLPHRWGWPSAALVVFAGTLAWTQLCTAVLPTLLFAALLGAGCAMGLLRYRRRRGAPSTSMQGCGNGDEGLGMQTF